MTIAAIVTLALGLWGLFETASDIATDRRTNRRVRVATRCGDVVWAILCGCLCMTAIHSLACTWGN